jgi:oligosaccharide repeat unit polymerase
LEYLVIVACIIMAFVSYVYRRDLFNPIFLFSAFWAVIMFLASLRWRGEYKADFYTMLIYLIGIVSFCLGCFFIGKRQLVLYKFETVDSSESKLNYSLIYAICTFVLIYSTMKFMRVIPLMRQGVSMGEIRALYWTVGSGITTNALDYFIDNAINKGFQLVVMVVASAEIASGNKSRFLIFSAVATTVLTAATSGGRMVFLDFIVLIVMSFLFYNRKVYISRKVKRIIVVACCIGVICMIYLTSVRQGSVSVLEALYADFTCNVPLMNQVILRVQETGDMTYGSTFFGGVIGPIAAILQYFGLIIQPQSISILSTYTVPFYDVGGGNTANAYTSSFFYFYLDGRILGVIIGDIIYGIICSNFYNKMKRNLNCKNVAIYLLIINTIFKTMIRFSFSIPSYVIAIILIPIIYRSQFSISINKRG